AAEMLGKRGLLIVFSDLLPAGDDDQQEVIEGLQHLKYRGHDVVCFQLLDHAELTFPFEGPVQFVDVETLQTTRADADAVAAAYREELQAFVE
ncbi:MAG: DUF58 domain-containing protein, partial [Xanthomonadales bacterium]|nr:DUF58 domain-containing protein [Xanthomonadales bacterium]